MKIQEDKIMEIINCVWGIVLEEAYNWSKEEIKEKLKQQSNRNANYVTYMYQAIVNALNKATYNKYAKNQDIVYEIAERIVHCWKNNSDAIEVSVIFILKEYSPYNDENLYQNFVEYLYDEIVKNTYLKERYLVTRVTNIADTVDGIENKVDKVWRGIEQIGTQQNVIAKTITEKQQRIGIGYSIAENNNSKDEYIEKWNSRLFLHKYDNKNLTLENTFIMPQYHLIKDGKVDDVFRGTLDVYLNTYFNANTNVPIVIEGPPGIGKTSISAWIAANYQRDERLYILKFRDWEKEELSEGLLSAILSSLQCKKRELNQKILVLDGYDEIKSLYMGDRIIANFVNDIKDIPDIKVIITSRAGYFTPNIFRFIIKLHPFSNEQIHTFYYSITGRELPKDRVFQNDEVLGIPVILYMAISSGVDISKRRSKGDLYNRIFAKKGGIFDRFSLGDNEGYDYGNQVLRTASNTGIFLDFLRNIAGEMLKRDTLKLKENEYIIPELDFQNTKVKVLDFPVKNLFERNIELEFVHTSIYEYFASEKLFELLDMCIKNKDANSVIIFMKELGLLFNNTIVGDEIWAFFRYKIQVNNEHKDDYKFINKVLEQMVQEGMLYRTGNLFKDHLKHEAYVFFNFLNLIGSWKKMSELKLK